MENKFDLKVGDVIQVKEGGWGFAINDIGKWVEIIEFGKYGSGQLSITVKEYDQPLLSIPYGIGEYRSSIKSFGENPMVLLNTKEEMEQKTKQEKHSHYFKECPYGKVDVYRILDIWEVTDPCLQHLVKKGLCAGKRGHKDFRRDLQDIIDTAQRRIDMLDEDEPVE